MGNNQYGILKERRFLPLFVTQFLGAFNDNFFKTLLVTMITFRLSGSLAVSSALLTTICGALFILPFFLFSATAGQMADKFPKYRLIRCTKLFELALAVFAAFGLYAESVYPLMAVLFLLGAQAAFFGPLKYGILPEHLRESELMSGNGLIEGGTFLAILIGTIAGGVIGGDAFLSSVVGSGIIIAAAVAGVFSAFMVPRSEALEPGLAISRNIFRATFRIIDYARSRTGIFLPVMGISWFWTVGFVFITEIPPYTKETLNAGSGVQTALLAAITIGIAAGNVFVAKALKGEISARHVPLASLGMSFFILALYFLSLGAGGHGEPAAVAEFFKHPRSWLIAVSMFGLAFCGGVYSVPLYVLLQARSEASHRARVMAGNNVVNALFMAAASVASAALLGIGLGPEDLFFILCLMNLFVTAYIAALLPEALLKKLLRRVLLAVYRVRVRGLENFQAAAGPLLITPNHVSFLDPLLLAVFLPGKPVFAVNTFIAAKWWMKPVLSIMETLSLDPTNPMATKALIEVLRQGKNAVIFPEGRITVTGSLMKTYEGPGMVADKTGASVLPVRIEGAEYTHFSKLGGLVRRRFFPQVTITVLPPRKINAPEELSGRSRRRYVKAELASIMSSMVFEAGDTDSSLLGSLQEAARIHGGGRKIALDIARKEVSYSRLLARISILAPELRGFPGKNIGVMLPNGIACLALFFALHKAGKVPAMLNSGAGHGNINLACKAAEVEAVITSRRFVEVAKLGEAVAALSAKVIYLEDLASRISLVSKLVRPLFPLCPGKGGDNPVVVLFTSGSEGTPKGVVLSHRNIQANRLQMAARIDFTPRDVVMNALPMFHSFGLTVGTLLPVLSGIKTFLYPSPLHYRVIPELCYDSGATMLFGTDTFLAGYARSADPYDFFSLRYVFAGAEKLKDVTRKFWFDKFGVRIFEGYGVTETSPVISINTPMENLAGTVGRAVPGMELRLEKVEGIETGGRLFVRGPNVMLGYLRAEKPGVLEPAPGGWHDTGDVVEINPEGFVRIAGRVKRFAKIGGEMVSLVAIEEALARKYPDYSHAVVALSDARKGERLALATTCPELDKAAVGEILKSAGFTELSIPKEVTFMEKLPLLGSGKTDYVGLGKVLAG